MGKSPKSKQGEQLIHLADEINFFELFRIKGRKGLWTMRSAPSPSGMLGMIAFMDYNERCVIHKRELQSLGHLTFQTLAGHKVLLFRDVFRNLFDAKADEHDFAQLDVADQMEIAVPCFDEDMFKPYHMEMVLMWYDEIIKKMTDAEKINKRGDKKENDIE